MVKESMMKLESEIESIREDSLHGATYLTLKAADAFKRAAGNGADMSSLREASVALAAARPMMASIFRFANDLLFLLDRRGDEEEICAFCDSFIEGMEESARQIRYLAAERLSRMGIETVMTHSYSSLVKNTLFDLLSSKSRMRVICTESRPKNEGVELARTLCDAGAYTMLAIDAAAPSLCRNVDLLLVGADGVGKFGLVHKIGTYPLLLAARESGVPVVVLAGTEKFWPHELEGVEEPPKSPDEIADSGCFEVMNYYFDTTPLEYIESIVTEMGIVSPGEALNLCREFRRHPLLSS